MSDNKFQGKFRIPSARHPWHNYNAGLYFITICTKDKKKYFGKIRNHEMQLSEIGHCTMECIENITNHFPDTEIPVYVIMPNHIHLIVSVQDNCKNVIAPVETPPVETPYMTSLQEISQNEKMQSIANQCGRLSHVISNVKSAVTRYPNNHQIPFNWQERFHDRIIRDTDECNRIADYIENNQYNWTEDDFYTA